MEAEHKLTEINKATYEFERDIIRGGVNKVCCNLPTFYPVGSDNHIIT